MSYLSPLLWAFLPPQLTQILLPYVSSTLPFLFPPSSPGTPGYRRNYRLLFTALVTLWLGYTFITQSEERSRSYYDVLGVSYGAGEAELKKAFRSLSRVYHPDRLGRLSEEESEMANARFVGIRRAYEILSEPTTRFIYDRFGPSVALCTSCKSLRDFMQSGLLSSVSFYIAALSGLAVLALARAARDGAYWRFTVVGVLLALELAIVLAPGTPAQVPSHDSDSEPTPIDLASPPVSAAFVPFGLIGRIIGGLLGGITDHRAPFQVVKLLRALATDVGIAISQLAGIWADPPSDPEGLARSNLALARELQAQANTALNSTVGPLLASGTSEDSLKDKVTDRLLDSNAVKHPAVLPAYDTRMRQNMRDVHLLMRQS